MGYAGFIGGRSLIGNSPNFDYTITSDAEWNTVFGLSTATLDGKSAAISGTSFTQRTINNHNFATGFTLTSINAGSSIPSLSLTGTVSKVTFDDLNLQMTGWPMTYGSLVSFGTGTFTDLVFRDCTFRHGYGASLVNADPTAVYDEYERIANTHTATTSSQTFALTWENPAMTSAWVTAFNHGAVSAFIKFGGAGVVATVSDTLVPTGLGGVRVIGLNPTTDTHMAIITASSTAEVNARTEIGLPEYQAPAFTAGGVGTTINNLQLIGNTFTDLCNAVKGANPAVVMDNTMRRIYQDIISGGVSGMYVLRNLYERPYARSGTAEAASGDARDPHGDDIQSFGATTLTDVYLAGNLPIYSARRTGAGIGSQGQFLSDINVDPSYNRVFSVGNIHVGGAPRGFDCGEASFPCMAVGLWGDTFVNYDIPADLVSIFTVTKALASTYVGYSIASGSSETGTGEQSLDNSTITGAIGSLATYFPDIADWLTAGANPALIAAAWSSVGGSAAGQGVDAVYDAIDWITSTPASVIQWAELSAGVGWTALVEQAPSSVITLPQRQVLNRRVNQTVVPGPGVEWQSRDTDGTTIVTAWTTSSGDIDPDQFIELRRTSGAEGATVAASATINGFLVSVDITSALSLTNPFTFPATACHFLDTANVPANTTVVEFEIKGIFTNLAGNMTLCQVVSDIINVVNSSNQHSLSVENSAGTSLFSSGAITSPTLPIGVVTVVNILVSFDNAIDMVTGTITQDGDVIYTNTVAFTTGTGTVQSTRACQFGSATQQYPNTTQVEYLKVWLTTSAVRTLRKEISVAALGSIAAINADPWHQGADVT